MLDVSLTFYAVAIPAAMLVGLAKGGLPVVGMVSVPLLALVTSPLEAAGLLLPIYVITDMFGLWFYRRDYDPRNLKILTPAAIAGVGVGWATASFVTEASVAVLVGSVGIAFCLNNWLRRHAPIKPQPADVGRGLFWGALSGFTSFVSHAGGPPYQLYVLPQRLEKMIYAGTTTILFAIINATKLVPYWALGQLSPASLRSSALLVPAGILATLVGVRLVRIIPEREFFVVVQTGLLLLSLRLTYQGLSHLLG
ncbi:membrane protein [Microvirga vignae]|uniref:Probable membrane transporter protein n=1 Tax=Microvirga vignae TaxID=1225564 RepID=A0A0H1R6B9_9HYPH|nr:sulfite exporter TauE/SafE family protein [Microvirga vignae]KLK90584.1 membrane protein [Microvirga vignae]